MNLLSMFVEAFVLNSFEKVQNAIMFLPIVFRLNYHNISDEKNQVKISEICLYTTFSAFADFREQFMVIAIGGFRRFPTAL